MVIIRLAHTTIAINRADLARVRSVRDCEVWRRSAPGTVRVSL